MRVAYVANHNQATGNDDEGAITHALRELGHEVTCVDESGAAATRTIFPCDLLLFHKWDSADTLRRYAGRCVRAFWWFDLVDLPYDPSLAVRNRGRIGWMERITPNVDVGFLTDGDWVARHSGRNLVWLPQGADERAVGRGVTDRQPTTDVLFTGIGTRGGAGRESFVREMTERWGSRFRHVPNGLHREHLRDAVASSTIVVCPDGPVTDRYWSNRVYNACGFGGFVIHPWCRNLAWPGYDSTMTDMGWPGWSGNGFIPGEEVMYYRSRRELHDLVADFLTDYPERIRQRERIAENALLAVRSRHLYRHRIERLVERVGRVR